MDCQSSRGESSVLSFELPQRIAVVGAGLAGLSCARELQLRGHDPVVFEASARMGGRCSSRHTRVGWFDDGAQVISGNSRLAAHAVQRIGELPALHPWTVAATPAEDERKGRDRDKDVDEADTTRTLKLMGVVGVPSMLALASAVARPLEVRLNTPIQQAHRRGARWVLHDAAGEIDGDFQALVLALPAPLALPLAAESPRLAAALGTVRYRSRWVLLLGTDRPVGLPGYREFQGSPIERVAAMHSKPGRLQNLPQRWFVEADERWSAQHEHVDAETAAELLLDNFRAHAGRPVSPNFLCAHLWRHACVETPAVLDRYADCLWDDTLRLGVCGDSVVASQVHLVHRSGIALAGRMGEALMARRTPRVVPAHDRNPRHTLEVQVAHG